MSSGSKSKINNPCHAIHESDGESHVVGIGNLRVIITNDGSVWFAQSYEIDYAVEGTSLNDVKKKFEKGLSATINEYLIIYGSIEKFLQPAPKTVLVDLMKTAKSTNLYSHVSLHVPEELPFSGIDYFQKIAA